MSIEDATLDFIQGAVDVAVEGDALFNAAVKDDYQTIKDDEDFGVIIGECTADLAPMPGGAMAEWDALLTIVCFARVVGVDKTERKAARNKARELMLAVAGLFFGDPMMNGQVRDSQVLRCRRGFDSITRAEPYAVANLPLIVNSTGQQIDSERRLYD
ncbi:MAG TPA: hypothetical protein VGN95_07200 [Pyrinomonadaceae bacterium]|nr:hypothetical protein [Pyrinomonadaceae bacterium]